MERVEVKDVRLPVSLQRAMAAEAEAAREAKAKVISVGKFQKKYCVNDFVRYIIYITKSFTQYFFYMIYGYKILIKLFRSSQQREK